MSSAAGRHTEEGVLSRILWAEEPKGDEMIRWRFSERGQMPKGQGFTQIIDALNNASGPILVKYSGSRILWTKDASDLLHTYAVDLAETALLDGGADERSIEALKVKRQWTLGNASDSELKAAYETAKHAAAFLGFLAVQRPRFVNEASAAASVAYACLDLAVKSARGAVLYTSKVVGRSLQNTLLEQIVSDAETGGIL